MGYRHMKDIIIVCAGNYGKEVYYTIRRVNEAAIRDGKEAPYHMIGFLSDVPDALEGSEVDLPIIGTIQDWKPVGDEVYALGLGTPASKKKVASMLKSRGCKFETIISPSVIIPDYTEIGEGCLIKAYHIASGVKIGNFVNIHGSMMMPGAVLGDYCTSTGFAVVENATIGEGVYIGSHCVVMEGVHVGDNVNIGAGSIVTQDVPSDKRIFGYPAIEMRVK